MGNVTDVGSWAICKKTARTSKKRIDHGCNDAVFFHMCSHMCIFFQCTVLWRNNKMYFAICLFFFCGYLMTISLECNEAFCKF